MGCESHLDGSYDSTEIFPIEFTVIRKDRVSGGGGVFIAFKKDLPLLEESLLLSEAEMIPAKLHQTKGKPVYICSFYRPPGSSCETLHCLRESLYKIVNREGSSCRIVLAGDFNFPDIYWEDGVGCIRTNPAYGCECKELFLDLLNDFALEQQVKEPTRGTRILDLVLSLQSQLISNVSVIPGMSDHEAVTFQLN